MLGDAEKHILCTRNRTGEPQHCFVTFGGGIIPHMTQAAESSFSSKIVSHVDLMRRLAFHVDAVGPPATRPLASTQWTRAATTPAAPQPPVNMVFRLCTGIRSKRGPGGGMCTARDRSIASIKFQPLRSTPRPLIRPRRAQPMFPTRQHLMVVTETYSRVAALERLEHSFRCTSTELANDTIKHSIRLRCFEILEIRA
jgi:hypothetical protein